MTNDIEEILMNDDLFRKHFVAVHPPKYEFKGEINPAFLGRNPHLDFAINWIKDYVQFPLIEDNFILDIDEHYLRRIWRTELIKKYGEKAKEFLKNNKFKINSSLSGMYSALSLVEAYLENDLPNPKKVEELKKMVESTEENPHNYKNLNIEGRIKFIREIEDRVQEILAGLSVNN